MYGALPYALAEFLVELPFSLVNATLFSLLFWLCVPAPTFLLSLGWQRSDGQACWSWGTRAHAWRALWRSTAVAQHCCGTPAASCISSCKSPSLHPAPRKIAKRRPSALPPTACWASKEGKASSAGTCCLSSSPPSATSTWVGGKQATATDGSRWQQATATDGSRWQQAAATDGSRWQLVRGAGGGGERVHAHRAALFLRGGTQALA